MPKLITSLRFSWGLAPIFTTVAVLIVIGFMSVVTFLEIRRTSSIFWDDLELRGVQHVDRLNDRLFASLYYLNLEELEEISGIASGQPGIERVQIFNAEGRLLVDSHSRYPAEVMVEEFGMRALKSQSSLVEKSNGVLEVASPIILGDKVFGGVWIGLGSEILQAQIREMLIEHLWQGLVLIAIAVALSYLISRSATKPIRMLTSVAQDIGGGNLHTTVPVGGAGEIRQLGQTLEHMRAELQTLYDQLEQRVEQRTRELAAANEELKREITERERAEDERRALEIKALTQSKLANLGEVAAGLAHEINQPLTYISTIGQVLLEDLKINQFDPDRAEYQLTEAHRQIGRINRIIEHLRTFGRADDGEMAPVDLETTLENSLLLLDQRIHLANIDLDLQVALNTPKIMGNANRLEQVFINLLQNSIDALEVGSIGGKIGVRLGEYSSEETGRPSVRIEFFDDGGGIPEEHINEIFDPFFSTKPAGKGTGLGLSIVYGIISDHGGTITCESESNSGTRFIITLPAEENAYV